MSQVDLGKFACDACNREYPWKPEYAGRKVKCKCGSVITAPTEAPKPAASEGDDDDLLGGLYDLAAQEQQAAKSGATTDNVMHCPNCHQEIMPGEAVCLNCSYNLRTKSKAPAPRPAAAAASGGGGGGGPGNPMLAYAGMNKRSAASARADAANAVGGSNMRELYIPAGLVVLGVLAQLFITGQNLPTIGLSVIINLVLSFTGVAIVAKMLDLGFGAPGPAVLKMVAICLLPAAIAQAAANVIGSDSAFVRHSVAVLFIYPLALTGFVMLFDLALDEAMYTSVVIYFVNKWAVVMLVAILLSGGFGGPSMSRETARADEAAAESLERPNATEARSWLAESGNRMYSAETHDSSTQMVDSLYYAGAKRVTTLSSSGEGYAMVVELPKKKADREKVIAAIRQIEQKQKVPTEDQTQDEGQRYHTFHFGVGSM